MTLYQSCSNYFDWLKNMAGMGPSTNVNIGKTLRNGKNVRETTLAYLVDFDIVVIFLD